MRAAVTTIPEYLQIHLTSGFFKQVPILIRQTRFKESFRPASGILLEGTFAGLYDESISTQALAFGSPIET